MVRQIHQPLRLFAPDPDHRHGPFDDSRLHVLKAVKSEGLLHRRLRHGEGIIPALEMIVGKNGTADNGKVRVGAQEIVGEPLHKIKQLHKRIPVDLHRRMGAVENDAVLIIINIGGILESPVLSV